MDNALPVTKVERGKVVGRTLLKIGATKSKSFVKRTFSSKLRHEELKEEMDEEVAKTIFEALGQLKGLSVKIAQQIALGMPFLPQTYLTQMQKSFHQIPPINRALVRKIIKNELGQYPEICFDTFDGNSFGSASLGQVHFATFGAEKLAVKIQYPGIKKTIESDMSLLKFGLNRIAKGHDVSHILKEVEERIYEEVDYEKEAENCRFFGVNLGLEDVVIPQVYEEFSTKHVLSCSFLKGKTFDELLKGDLKQEDINRYAQLIFDSFFHSVYNLKILHADPNPGNFIFMDDCKLGMIDFGCIKNMDDDFLIDYNRLYLSLIAGASDEDMIERYQDLGMIYEDTDQAKLDFYQNTIKPFDRLYIEVFNEDSYNFKENNNFSKRGFDLATQAQKHLFDAVHKINQEFIFLDRTLLGYYAMFEQMGAKIDTRNAIKIMKDFELDVARKVVEEYHDN